MEGFFTSSDLMGVENKEKEQGKGKGKGLHLRQHFEPDQEGKRKKKKRVLRFIAIKKPLKGQKRGKKDNFCSH